ncbi:glycoside hydrolase family 18 protein [Gymnopilus junonius]|uniref:Glycoside hydrolase family 18 protein n=1 Tax=Gymnopilus junonius TaxID=109634 RepID=A0A9P5NMF9_GYMJU|nr:glycoside hydrolase family 18 protein [Gymnopilus junonius]
MSTISSVFIVNHTTCSDPCPHILYVISVHRDDGSQYEVLRRYSEFVTLREKLNAPFSLPPKRNLVSVVLPYKWIDDGLINERKRGLQLFLTLLIYDTKPRQHPDLLHFLDASDLDYQESMIWPPLSEMASKESLISVKTTVRAPDTPPRPVAGSYYPSWASDTIPISKIDFSKFDILFFAFVTPNGTAGINWDEGSQETLKKLVSGARNSGQGTKIVLSVGGWSGSHWYSQAMSTERNRSKLVKILAETVESYSLDGIDIDWEYPNAPGAGNPHSSADAGNLLDFFKMLRNTLGSSKIISAAVTHLPWLGENGQPLNNVAEYAKYMTYVNVMNYDVFGPSAHPGPNAPLDAGNLCGSSSQPQETAQAALAQWKSAGMPASKILLGLPLYGYVCKSSDKRLSGSSIPSSIFQHGAHPKFANQLPHTSAPLGDLSALWGQQISFSQLVRSGALVKKSDGTYIGANGYTMGWDNCSDTPYLFNTSRTTVVTYDDTYSIASKTAFAKQSGMGGCFTWSLDQDDELALHNVILQNLVR